MFKITKINNEKEYKDITREKFVDFLFTHLDQFGDPKEDINKCLDYAFSKEKS